MFKIRNFMFAIPLIIIGILIILIIIPFNHAVSNGTFVFPVVLGIIYLIIYFPFRKTRDGKFNYIPNVVTIIFVIIISSVLLKHYIRSKVLVILEANRRYHKNGPIIIHLSLYINNTYRVKLPSIEVSRVYYGQYDIIKDTLFLKNDISDETNGDVPDKYLVNLKESHLIPIENSHLQKDSTNWIEIESAASEFEEKINNH